MERIEVSSLSAGSVFRFGFLANAAVLVPIMLVVGLMGMSGGTAVEVNGQPVHGIAGVLTAICLGLVMSTILGVWLLLGTLILRLLKDRGPSLRIGD